jgi:hypothetical protein
MSSNGESKSASATKTPPLKVDWEFYKAGTSGDVAAMQALGLPNAKTVRRVFEAACVSGDLKVVQYLVLVAADTVRYEWSSFQRACAHGHAAVAQCLVREKLVVLTKDERALQETFAITCGSGREGCFSVAKWLQSKAGRALRPGRLGAWQAACVAGNRDVADWLLTLGLVLPQHIPPLFVRELCAQGRVQVLVWLDTLRLDWTKAQDTGHLCVCIAEACERGHLDTAKHVFARVPTDVARCSPSSIATGLLSSAMQKAKARGFVDVCSWLQGCVLPRVVAAVPHVPHTHVVAVGSSTKPWRSFEFST